MVSKLPLDHLGDRWKDRVQPIQAGFFSIGDDFFSLEGANIPYIPCLRLSLAVLHPERLLHAGPFSLDYRTAFQAFTALWLDRNLKTAVCGEEHEVVRSLVCAIGPCGRYALTVLFFAKLCVV